ncbi:hypothetical protein ABFS82_04G086500 [Erythranthe guttata]|uniref:probable protein phosphatase 2C 24 n=1 Tax=Erythranthe guttata TaxID=4155 RepID=UPI00064DC9CC|nr:PREDICTED: probable protein phosphatase 2C 24 [Erythranthe guttata]|eukprot:XP_012836510.1 PREDICTED: probable protein phosphatase 2C 24 [Erythranthe guttata]
MAEICSTGVVGEISGDDSSGRAARRRRMELRRVRLEPDGVKRRRLDLGDCDQSERQLAFPNIVGGDKPPKFGIASVCGRRRDMEDAVAVHPSFCERSEHEITSPALHYFGVYDGHGCSHVATKCKERLHQMVKEELRVVDDDDDKDDVVSEGRMNTRDVEWWKCVMGRSFTRMDKEAVAICNRNDDDRVATCRCELQTPEREAVGSTAVVAVVTPDKIVVANCGDSRAVLCRNGKAVPLSTDHKPDRPDELSRIEAAGGRVIYWQGARVLGVLAMSRAIGDNYLKPYVSCEPEVTMTDRTEEDECLILASDGLWDVVSEDTACGIALMCLKGGTTAAPPPPPPPLPSPESESSDKACNDASMLLTKLALARRSSDNVTVVVVDLTTKPS